MLRSFLFLFSVLVFVACSDADTITETDDLGNTREYTINPETKLREGTLKEYDKDGNLLVEEHYQADQLEGERTVYNLNGSVAARETYVGGKFNGPYQSYDEEGNLAQSGQFRDGVMADTWYGFYPDGGLRETVTYQNNTENGPFREWYADGRPKASGQYMNGDREQGLLHKYDEQGELTAVMLCAEGMCKTMWTPDSLRAAPRGPDMTMPAIPNQK